MDDRNVMRHLRDDNDISWVCQFCGHPFPWEVQPETFRHHLTRMCESAPEDVKEEAQRIEEEAVEADEFSASVEGNDSNFKAKTEGSKYECQELQVVEEEVSSVKRTRREGSVQSSYKRHRSMPYTLPIAAEVEVPMVEGIQDIGESASLTKRPVGDAFKRNEEMRKSVPEHVKEAVQRREVETAECSRSVEVNREPTRMASPSSFAIIREVRLASSSYDVFLSFRGEDTRKGFISHLRAALDKKQILTFDDENMSRGAGISPSILTAIEKSTISLIIFSENYADSTWCLKELAKTLQCKELNGQIVIPVFYGVDPTNIKKQTGKFGLAFDKLKERLGEGEMDLNEVRSHLKEAANIVGWNSHNRLECELITLIVQNIDAELKVLKRQSASLTKRLVGDEGQLQKLKVTLRTVTKVIGDAEQKQFSDRDVREWIDDLKDAAFRAEDFLDEIDYEVLKLKIESGGAQTSADAEMSVGEMEPRLKEIHETLEHLVKQRGPFGLEEKNSTGEERSLKLDASSPTTSLIDASSVYGRDGDKERVVKLLRSDDGIGMNLGVVLIVGMGGMGKTTLAKLVCKDDRVQQCFDLKPIWVYVPKVLEAFQVTKEILKEVELEKDIDKMTTNQMHCELERKLSGNKVLLVLDDVWVVTQGEWDSLMEPFMSVKQGSKIIVTTRDSSVARTMPSVRNHYLAGLNEDNCWLLFAKYAFDNKSYHEYLALEKIGREMVKKCNGLPLAAKALGGILRYERRVERWKEILNNNIWASTNDEVLPALRLSYFYLPSSLKQCFAYCAMFPKNYQFKKEELVLLWVAEGFIAPSRREDDMEMTGERYFEDLVSRSFLQQQSPAYGKTFFTMHDLLNDMATLVSREFCSRLEAVNSLEVTQRTRYLSCIKRGDDRYGIEDLKCVLGKPHFLRTLFLKPYDKKGVSFNLLEALKSLRVLHLSRYVGGYELPDSIGILKHLRYLRFYCPSNIQQLPEFICKLYNLQILIVRRGGAFTKLPNNMRKLVNLFLLDIGDTRLQEMPPHMGELTKLRKLRKFVLGKQKQAGSSSDIKELAKLHNLRGSLSVEGLQNVMDFGDAMGAILSRKQHLEELELKWDHGEDNNNCLLHQQRVLEKLVPHTDLKSLFVYGYGGERFADWVGDSSFSCMVSLEIENCKILSLPPVCRLASLERFTIRSCDGVTSIGSELHSMKKLRYLSITRMQEWCEWISDGDDSETNFPLLQELEIEYCPKLRKALPSHLPSVAEIKINSCEQLEIECFSLECFPMLKDLKIWICPKLVSICKGRSPNFSSNLATLSLVVCPNLKVLPESRLCSNLEFLLIESCPEIEIFPTNLGVHLGGSNSKLRGLVVSDCKKLFSRRHEWGLEMLPSLLTLHIDGCDEMEESFPEKMLLPSTLTDLRIGDLPNLKSLNYDGLQPLTSLKLLFIWDCGKLQSLQPNQIQKLPTSLSHLAISGCPLLRERCQPEKGVDWPFISHIPKVDLDNKRISK